jgi:hypothetical protein
MISCLVNRPTNFNYSAEEGTRVGLPIFLSRATPEATSDRGTSQDSFLSALRAYLRDRGLEPWTVGDTHFAAHGIDEIRGLINRANGLVTVAFKRDRVIGNDAGTAPPPRLSDSLWTEGPDTYITTPWCHMETAMAYQIGLPILILIEDGVRADGALEQGVIGEYPPTFKLGGDDSDLDLAFGDDTEKWRQLVRTWEGNVREVVRTRSRPPSLFNMPNW